MSIPQRGKNAVRGNPEPTDPRWGGLDPKEYFGKVKLMEHSAYGERYFRTEDVENRESRGWAVVAYRDPTTPIAPTPDAGVQVGQHPGDRPDIVEAAPTRAPRKRTRK